MTLSDKFHELYSEYEKDPEIGKEIYKLISEAPESPERSGLLGLLYHEGIGVPVDLDKSFEYAEQATTGEGDGLGYFLLGYMCDNAETPDQAEGGPRQKYDHYDAERFYELCTKFDSRWREAAILWLGDYYMNMAQGGDPEVAVEYYESIADHNADAAGCLSDYYWNLVMPEYFEDEEWTTQLFKWTSKAVELDPEEYSHRMGWIYADGLGCEKSYEKAKHYFEEAYNLGDWRGAQALATLLEEYIEEHPDLNEKKKRELSDQINIWKEREKEMYEQSLTEDDEEYDSSIEED